MSDPLDGAELVNLPDGRVIEVRASGPPDGEVLIFHHGTPGSGVPLAPLERAAHARGLRVVSPTRPGYGRSSRREGRRVVDVVADMAGVLAHLGVDRCLVAGWSGGGPHALACAAGLAQARAALVISGVGPYDADGLDWLAGMGQGNLDEFGAAAAGAGPLRRFLEHERSQMMGATLEQVVEQMASLLPPVDLASMTDEVAAYLLGGVADGLAGGVDGWLDDDVAFITPWGFDLDSVSVPTALWQGSADLMVPFSHGEWLAAQVPGVRAHLLEGEGHLSIGIGAMDEMLDELVAAGS